PWRVHSIRIVRLQGDVTRRRRAAVPDSAVDADTEVADSQRRIRGLRDQVRDLPIASVDASPEEWIDDRGRRGRRLRRWRRSTGRRWDSGRRDAVSMISGVGCSAEDGDVDPHETTGDTDGGGGDGPKTARPRTDGM